MESKELPLKGNRFGNYEIIEEIARGGMGIVYRAKQIGVEREVALKVILGGSRANSIEIRRFLREAKASSMLQHPNIVPLYNIGEEGGYHYFTMKYIPGSTFEDYIRNQEISLNDKLKIFIKICKALDYAHKQKILHRDIKPSNILMDKEGNPYLTDFGVAKFINSKSSLTQTGRALGTPYYMSPEQVKSAKYKVDQRSDIYSLGIILYSILTQKLPFYSETLASLYQKICETPAARPRKIDPDIDRSLDSICMKSIEKIPNFRYQNAMDLAKDISDYLQGSKVEAEQFNFKVFCVHNYQKFRKAFLIVFSLLAFTLFFIALYPTAKEKLKKKA